MTSSNKDTDKDGAGHESAAEITDPRGTPAFFEYWNQMDFVTWMGRETGKIQE